MLCRFIVLTWLSLSCNGLCQSKSYVLKKCLKFWTLITNKKISFVFIMCNTYDSPNPTNQVSHMYYPRQDIYHLFIATKHFYKEIVLKCQLLLDNLLSINFIYLFLNNNKRNPLNSHLCKGGRSQFFLNKKYISTK